MKKQLHFLCLLLLPMMSWAQNNPLPFEKTQLDSAVYTYLEEYQTAFDWDQTSDRFLWSALVHSDSMVSIGFRPATEQRIRARIHEIDVEAPEWQAARQGIVDYILETTSERYGMEFSEERLFPFGVVQQLPFLSVKVFDLQMLKYLRTLPQVRYVHPMSFKLSTKEGPEKSTSGCGSVNENINANDYTAISPQSRASWHHQPAGVDVAWNNSNKGDDIWVAVVDSGISDENDKLDSEFDEGESSGRSLERKSFYRPSSGAPYDGWQDQCGHGTRMLSLIAAPRGFDDTPAGIAYRCNLVSYRAVEDVVVNTSEEKMGVSEAFMDIGDDPRIKIVSMSLGDLFYNGQVADAIIYAHNKGKLIFTAAGTSTFFTGFFVIFPATMDETIAVTGVKDQNINNRTKCNTCHSGSRVDFVNVMQRASDNDRTAITLNVPDNSQAYTSGSSAATASTAGIATLVWGNHPDWTSGQVLNQLIQSSDYYPNRDGDFGWGKIDAAAAVADTPPIGCTTTFSNEATIEITNIAFPASDDGFFDSQNEWVIQLGSESFFFNVEEDGASGNPANYIDIDVCGSIPMTIDLGSTACNEAQLDLFVSSHEDDGLFSDCDHDNGLSSDDLLASETLSVDLNSNTFTHQGAAGDFVFTYVVYCSPTATPAASVVGDTMVCQNNPAAEVEFTAAGGQAPYTISYTVNQGSIQNIQTIGNTVVLEQATDQLGTFTYELTKVEDANGCFQAQNDEASVEVIDNCSLKINTKVFLQGNFKDGLMQTNLQIPATDPYGNGAVVNNPSSVFAANGDDTIVDWVEVILRAEDAPHDVVSRQSALLQADGDVVATDGVSALSFTSVLPDSYFVSIQHRNHLEVSLEEVLLLLASED
ncbi:MAG: S8/S53 family peptidase [Bacteroidota bacterium]